MVVKRLPESRAGHHRLGCANHSPAPLIARVRGPYADCSTTFPGPKPKASQGRRWGHSFLQTDLSCIVRPDCSPRFLPDFKTDHVWESEAPALAREADQCVRNGVGVLGLCFRPFTWPETSQSQSPAPHLALAAEVMGKDFLITHSPP